VRCHRCADENPENARFCVTCGVSLEAECRRCGTPNRVGNRYCYSCGEELGAARTGKVPADDVHPAARLGIPPKLALEDERKQVTVLFADVKSSLELITQRDAEEARDILDPLLERMIEAVHYYEGTVNQVLGDGIMALFGAPAAHEDHAVRACYAALRMQETVGRISEELERRLEIPVRLRVGLNSGEVVVRAIGNDYSAVGQTTHLAARMEQMTAPGKILITTETLRLAEGAIRVVPLGQVSVKGLAQPAEVFQLVGAGRTRLRFAAALTRGLTPLVGRRAELAMLRDVLGGASLRGRVMTLVGEPGVGKSRLAWEFAQACRGEGWLVLSGSGFSHARGVPYGPIVGCLREYFQLADDAEAATVREVVSTKLRMLDPKLEEDLPALLALLDVLPPDAPFRQAEHRIRRGRTLEAVRRLLLRASQDRTVLLVLEDAHWFDPESQGVLDLLVEGLSAGPLHLLLTYRPEYRHSWGGRSSYTQVRIDPLPPASAEELLRRLLGEGRDLDPVIQLLGDRCDGNPFFLEESVRTLIESGVLSGERGAYRLVRPLESIQVPPTIQAVLAARIDRLPAAHKEIVQCAAVIGRDFSYALLRPILSQSEEQLKGGLALLEDAELIYEAALFPELECSFKHALTHQVAYEGLLHARRKELHSVVLATMERQAGERPPEVERLAQHAVQGQQWGRALVYLRQSGARAFSCSAYRLAASWFERALAVLPHLPADRATIEEGINIRLDLRSALSPLGQFGRMLECLREAESLARELGDGRRLAQIASYLANYFQVMGDLESAVEHGQRALDIAVREEDVAIQVVSRAYLSLACQTLGEYARGIEFARQNLEALGRSPHHEWFGMALLPAVYSSMSLVRCLAETGEFTEALEVGARGMRIAEEVNHAYSLMFACLGLGFVHVRGGRVDEGIALLERSLGLCKAGDSPAMTSLVAAFLAAAYAQAGRLDEAIALADEAEEHAAGLGFSGATLPHGVALGALADAHLRGARLAEAEAAGLQARENFARMRARGYEAWVLLTLGTVSARRQPPDVETAERYYRDALTLAEQHGMRPLAGSCRLALGDLHGNVRFRGDV
jgi:class 3 adenylate cyclase/tetratricopeptide (TPR) repeat protein